MPWQEMSPVNLRMHFVTEWQRGCWTMTELCADYQISRKTGYKWLERYAASGPRGLHDRSRRPPAQPVGDRHGPGGGARRAAQAAPTLGRQEAAGGGGAPRPARGVAEPIDGVRPVEGAGVGRAPAPPRSSDPRGISPLAADRAHRRGLDDRFQRRISHARWPVLLSLTVRDGFSRFVLRCDALVSPTYDATRRRFARAFAEYGLPDRIRSDNGPPFASTGLAGFSRLSVWWIRLGIRPERSRRVTPSKTDRTNNSMPSLKPRPRGRPPLTREPSSAGLRASVPNTTTSGRTRRWTMMCRRVAIGRRYGP